MEVLALPAGFSYVTFSHSDSTMSDGFPTPLALDGMGSFEGGRRHGHGHGHGHGDHLVRLVRNSEDRNPAGTVGGLLGDRSKAYDPTAYGGTVTLVYDEGGGGWSRTSSASTARPSTARVGFPTAVATG